MEPGYAPRTVAFVALASLVLGFLAVFGGGMLVLRPRSREAHHATDEPRAASHPIAPSVDGGAAATPPRDPFAVADSSASTPQRADDAGHDAATPAAAPPAAPVSAAGITLTPASTSRCFDRGPPTPIAGSHCDRLTGLDQYVASKAPQIAACARSGSHGHLALVLDFRFSTSFLRGWGSPTSNIPNPGVVSACVKRAITPLPFASIPHEHDRYLVVVGIDW